MEGRYFPKICEIRDTALEDRRKKQEQNKRDLGNSEARESEAEWAKAKYERRTRVQEFDRLEQGEKHKLAEIFATSFPRAVLIWSDYGLPKDLVKAQIMLWQGDEDAYRSTMRDFTAPPENWNDEKQEECVNTLKDLIRGIVGKENNPIGIDLSVLGGAQ